MFDHRYAEAAPDGVLEEIEIVAVGIKDADGNYKPECQQQKLDGSGPVESIADLRSCAGACKPQFDAMVIEIASEVSTDAGWKKSNLQIKVVDLKAGDRIGKKAKDDYDDRVPGPGISWVFDVLRARCVGLSSPCPDA